MEENKNITTEEAKELRELDSDTLEQANGGYNGGQYVDTVVRTNSPYNPPYVQKQVIPGGWYNNPNNPSNPANWHNGGIPSTQNGFRFR